MYMYVVFPNPNFYSGKNIGSNINLQFIIKCFTWKPLGNHCNILDVNGTKKIFPAKIRQMDRAQNTLLMRIKNPVILRVSWRHEYNQYYPRQTCQRLPLSERGKIGQ